MDINWSIVFVAVIGSSILYRLYRIEKNIDDSVEIRDDKIFNYVIRLSTLILVVVI